MEVTAQRITPFLWFDGRAEEAASFYVSLFPNSEITERTHYGDHGPGEKGEIMTVAFSLAGLQFTALNGGPHYTFTPAVSFAVGCDTQEEIDRLWDGLTADGGEPVQCGWVTDRFGLSWQIVPNGIAHLVGGDDGEGSQRAMAAMMNMVKLDIAALRAAYEGTAAVR